MATHDWVTDYAGYSTEQELPLTHVGVIQRYFDTSSVNMTASDVYQVFKVGNGILPIHFIVHVVTAEGATATLDIGDGSSTTRYEDDANLNSAGTTVTLDGTTMYTGDDTIDIIPSANLDTAKFWVTMVYVRLTT